MSDAYNTYSINTESSFNKLIDKFYFRIFDATEMYSKEVVGEDIFKKLSNELNTLKEVKSKTFLTQFYALGFLEDPKRDIDSYKSDYKEQLKIALKPVQNIRSIYNQFSKKVLQEQCVTRNKRSLIYKLDEDLSDLKIRIEKSTLLELENVNQANNQENPNSFNKVLDRNYKEKKSLKDFLLELKEAWNVNNKSLSEIIGIGESSVNFALKEEIKNIDNLVATKVSTHFYNKLNEKLFILLSGDNSLGTNKEIISKFNNLIKNEFSREERHKLAGECLGEILKRNGVAKISITNNPDELNDFILRGVRPSGYRINKIAESIPFINEAELESLKFVLSGALEINQMIKSGIFSTKDIIESAIDASLFGKTEFAKHFGVDFSVIDRLTSGENIKITTAIPLAKKLGVSQTNEKDFCNLVCYSKKKTILETIDLYKEFTNYNEMSLKDLRENIGILKKITAEEIGITQKILERIERNNLIPENLIDKFLSVYMVPNEFRESFASRFKASGHAKKIENRVLSKENITSIE